MMQYLAHLAASALGILMFQSLAMAQSSGRYELLGETEIVEYLSRGLEPASKSLQLMRRDWISVEVQRRLVQDYRALQGLPSVVIGKLTFDNNSSKLSVESANSLARLVSALRKLTSAHPDEVFLIEGHTDFPGSEDLNERLSIERAKSVYEFLLKDGDIPRKNLLHAGFGRRHLKIQTTASEPQNRRVEIRRVTPLLISEPVSQRNLSVCLSDTPKDLWRVDLSGSLGRDTETRLRDALVNGGSIARHSLIEKNGHRALYHVQTKQRYTECAMLEVVEAALIASGFDVEKDVSITVDGGNIVVGRRGPWRTYP